MRVGEQLRRDVPTHGDDCGDRLPRANAGAIGHRRALREAGRDDRHAWNAHTVEHLVRVLDVVVDHQLAVLPRHPARHHFFRTSAVETVKTLDRDQRPAIGCRQAGQSVHLDLGVLHVAVESRHDERRFCDFAQQHAAVRTCGNIHELHVPTARPRP